LYGLGAAIAAQTGIAIDWRLFAWGQLTITATQTMTHFCNDYFDLAADMANVTPTRWSGGSRALLSGELEPRVALHAALLFGGGAVGSIALLTMRHISGPLTAPLLIAVLVLSWEYSAPPLRLHSRGLGELNTALVVSLLTPLVGFYLQSRRLASLPLLASVPLCCFQFAMLLSIEFPDEAGDAAVGKRTLVVRFGARPSAMVYSLTVFLGYASLPALVALGLPRLAAGGVLLTLPLAFWALYLVVTGAFRDASRWERLAFATIATLMASAVGELLAFAWLAW
jgi:1,4-dihydroxy-2-naphthoate octaprenyltransferase